MINFGLFFVFACGAAQREWLLITGFWDDSGGWSDTSVWVD